MGMGFAPTWLRQVSPPASQNHFNHCVFCQLLLTVKHWLGRSLFLLQNRVLALVMWNLNRSG